MRIDDKGRVVDVIILKNDSHPSFSQAVERGALRMVYERAEPACKGKLRERTLLAEFRLYDEVKEKPKQRVSP